MRRFKIWIRQKKKTKKNSLIIDDKLHIFFFIREKVLISVNQTFMFETVYATDISSAVSFELKFYEK